MIGKKCDLNLLVTFYYLYKTNSVSETAKLCCLSQSAVSHSLGKLRVLTNEPLFERKKHQMIATTHAVELFPTVEKILSLFELNILPKQNFCPSDYQGVYKIGLSDYAEFIFAPQIYDALLLLSPKAKIEFVNVNRQNYNIVSEQQKLDIIIGSIPRLDEKFQQQKLYTEKHCCIFDRQRVVIDQLDIDTFCQYPHALVSPDSQFSTQVDRYLQEKGLPRDVNVISKNFLTIARLVQDRAMFAIIPRKVAEIRLFTQSLTAVEPPIPVADFDINLIWLKQDNQRDRTQWLIEQLRSLLTVNC
ncbi:LysR family transcriptional regulator [Vibrio sp. SS-MA-C1-2]|uniref:LysR family transcriptional regulator n=1 Tax=Vibrio sp. SS-MA-C1-2 TaxID=2908646 RepID=UPI001F33E6F1|nr:LysR family transcriptional regulator [Vibrio sp. SS-MA-C1-2]UJF17366.1 LysR family transcriptional regulator [Vibrio sp. SS-MA-C1-2]